MPSTRETVKVVLRSRRAGWQGALFGIILPSHALRGEDLTQVWTDRIDNPTTGEPIASGPFLVEGWSRGRQLTLVPNRRYWGRRPHVDRLVFRFGLASEDLLPSFRAHEIDLAWGLPPGFVAVVQQERDLEIATSAGSNLDQIWIRMGPGGHPALKHKLVRRALAYSIDRVALVRQLLGEIGPEPARRGQRGVPDSEPVLRADLALVSARSGARASPALPGWLPARFRRRPGL